ncbi:hypothetical protein HK405_007265 [Cladochytrium tenue]|nr:hypothetical protein HK405_007265 [Cladochytrium tenue]
MPAGSRRHRASGGCIIAIAGAIIAAIAPSGAAAQCFDLTGTTTCTNWASYQAYGNTSVMPFEASVSAFDAYLSNSVDTTNYEESLIQGTYDCPGYTGVGFRYHLTTLCGLYVDTATANDGCNGGTDVAVTTCATSATAFLQSAEALFADSNICNQSPSSDVSTARQTLTQTVQQFVTGLGDNSANCITAIAGSAEGSNCGYYDNASALSYCTSNPTQSCCTSVSGFTASAASTTSKAASGSSTSTTKKASTSSTSSAASSSSSTVTASSDSTASATILGLSQPVFIGAVAGVVAVLIAVVVAVVMVSRRNKSPPGGKSLGTMERNNMDGNQFASTKAPMPGGQNMPYYGNNNNNMGGGDPWGQGNGNYGMQDMSGAAFAAQQMQMQQPPQAASPFGNAPAPVAGGIPLPAGLSGGAGAFGGGGDPNQVSETMEVVFNYVPNLSDEIYLYVGDAVIVKARFDDGWGYGFNMTTKMEGSFPLACVAAYTAAGDNGQRAPRGDEWTDGSGRSVNRASFAINKRQSSMYGPPSSSGAGANGYPSMYGGESAYGGGAQSMYGAESMYGGGPQSMYGGDSAYGGIDPKFRASQFSLAPTDA